MQKLLDKLDILADAAKYDVSCSSGSSARNPAASGVCHAYSADGRCISLLKVLLSNHCIYECAYCANRSGSNTPRASFTPEELAQLTVAFYRRNYIEGLFLSSGVMKTPDHTMEQMIRVLDLLRHKYSFRGFIHLKLIPGAAPELITRASLLADRVSSNLELPSSTSLKQLAPQKSREAVLSPMRQLKSLRDARQKTSAMSTQLIVGASPESDRDILTLSSELYNRGLLVIPPFSTSPKSRVKPQGPTSAWA
jgi:predicted DNA-binding helix-hairpin-helix protein